MKNRLRLAQVKKGMLMSVSAQVISLLVSFLLNLVVPKYISEYQYAYWQTFMLYASYVGVLHFGLLDGIVLRYAQYDYEELDKPRMRSQFMALLVMDGAISLVTLLIGAAMWGGVTGRIVLLVALSIVTRNVFTYTSYSFQITNRISKYATLIIAQRAFYGAGVILLLLRGVDNFVWLCVVDLCSDLFGIVLGARFNRGLYFGSLPPLKEVWQETRTNISAGIMLLIANWASQLLVGGAKMIVQWHWDDLIFGKVSFAFSVSNLFLTFATAISIVLFPSLKRMDPAELPTVYRDIRGLLSPVLILAMLFYFPGCLILELWLPKYADSLPYLGILLPVMIFSSTVSLLTNNYLKAYRREETMLRVNVLSIAAAACAYVICAYVLDSLNAMLVAVVLVIVLRAVLSELAAVRIMQMRPGRELWMEIVMTVIFIICARFFSLLTGCICYGTALAIYAIINRNELQRFFYRNKGEDIQ